MDGKHSCKRRLLLYLAFLKIFGQGLNCIFSREKLENRENFAN